MIKSKRLVFFGNERLATGVSTSAPALRALVQAGYCIDAVIANHDEATSRQKRPLEIGEIAHQNNIPLVLIGEADLATEVKKYPAEAAVLAAFGRIIPQAIIDLFPAGIINIHPSLLPKLRGSTPVETAILEGLSQTGVSLMSLSAKMDAGPVYAQAEVSLSGQETKQELADSLSKAGAELLAAHLESILDGSLQPIAQDETQATYTKMIKKTDGLVDWAKPAQQLEREVRAYASWPKSQAKLKRFDVILTKVRIAQNESDGNLVQKCSQGWLEIEELVGPSGRTMSGADFRRGYGA